MSKRLELLEKAARDGAKDPFVWYGLAMEYRGAGRREEALQTFTKLRAEHPGYVPTYLMCAQLLAEMGRPGDARSWLDAGIPVAERAGDARAVSEIEDALATLG